MFSKKGVILVCAILLVAMTVMGIALIGRYSHPTGGPKPFGLYLIAPIQKIATRIIAFTRNVWNHYFHLVSAAKENERLKKELRQALKNNQQQLEIELANRRLRALLNFKKRVNRRVITAEVIGKDPSHWYKTVIIDKGEADGVYKGSAVVGPSGVAGQVIETLAHYAKVLLMIDHNSSIDAVAQKKRARGVVKGDGGGRCRFEYVLRKHDIRVNDVLVTTGMDGVFPKGQAIGYVSGVVKRNSGEFQEIAVTPFVDFENVNEMMVLLNPIPRNAFHSFRGNP